MWILFLAFGCGTQEEQTFIFRDADHSGITFRNEISASPQMNYFTYLNFYNGGGIAVGDINKDGLPDLYFTGNQVENKLYLNRGKLRFEDITAVSGTAGTPGWTTGVTMADVNGDGWLDIYVCKAGNYLHDSPPLRNLLYLNRGDNTFREAAARWGIDDGARSVHATFFDYDNDNDLDLYVVNHPAQFHALIEQRLEYEEALPDEATDRLYRNDGLAFTDVTDQAGVRNWAFGLNCVAADLNHDGWTDLYVSNDYSERDNYWVNNGDGTFREGIFEAFRHLSNFSMGGDAADFNNDGLLDLVVVDMVAEDNRRKKANMSGMNPAVFWDNVSLGRHYQYMQNTLQLNNGDGTFSDMAELAGVAYTDWSWAPLFGDLDNDGWKDLLITNGMRRDVRNSDLQKKIVNTPLNEIAQQHAERIKQFPVEPVSNYVFRNNRDLTFQNMAKTWNLESQGFSNGAVLSDLDRDGDLDIVLNDLDDQVRLYENTLSRQNYLQVQAEGPDGNPYGIGLCVKIKTAGTEQLQEITTSRGFQSGSEPFLHFGLGEHRSVDEVRVTWPGGRVQIFKNVKADQVLSVSHKHATDQPVSAVDHVPWLHPMGTEIGITYAHQELPFDDYAEQVLLPHQYSQNGPMLAMGDADGNGLADVFVGGAKGQAGVLFLQQPDRKFVRTSQQPWEEDAAHEDMGALFFDLENDGDLDLYVASGSNEWPEDDPLYRDRIYLNNGNGRFVRGKDLMPDIRISSGRMQACDFDQDGDMDLCISGRMIPGKYPMPAKTTLLENVGGKFVDATERVLPALLEAGLITDLVWVDYDQDRDEDLVILGEWTPVRIFRNTAGTFAEVTEEAGLAKYTGWWYALEPCDPDRDGDIDFVAGNLGLNAKYQGTLEEPLQVYYDDFDRNGSGDIVLSYFNEGRVFPVRGRECSSQQIPDIAKKYPTYAAFSTATTSDIFGAQLQEALHYSAGWLATSYLENKGDGTFVVQALPNEAQLSPVLGIAIRDMTGDGEDDIILAGNMYRAEVETCRHDASIGLILEGDGQGSFKPVPGRVSGFLAHGDVKDLGVLTDDKNLPLVVVTRNDGPVEVFANH